MLGVHITSLSSRFLIVIITYTTMVVRAFEMVAQKGMVKCVLITRR